MASTTELSALVALISRFEALDAQIADAVSRGELEIVGQTIVAKKEIKRFLAQQDLVKTEPALAAKLKQIRDNYGYTIDRFFSAIQHDTGVPFSQDAEEIDYVDALFSEGTADYVDEGFFTRRNQVGTLIVSESLPDHFIQHFRRLRECYALGLFHAAVVYCRAVIEAGCFEALIRRGDIPRPGRVTDAREYSLKELMRSVRRYVYKPLFEAAWDVIKLANRALHSKDEEVAVKQEEAYEAIRDTIAIVEDLFAGRTKTSKC